VGNEGIFEHKRAFNILMAFFKAIQNHWDIKISSKANFINSQVPDEEGSLGWETMNEYFEEIFDKSKAKLERINRLTNMESYSGKYEEESKDHDDEDENKYSVEEYDDEPVAKKAKSESGDNVLINSVDKISSNFFGNLFSSNMITNC
jgi:hypothetical protein